MTPFTINDMHYTKKEMELMTAINNMKEPIVVYRKKDNKPFELRFNTYEALAKMHYQHKVNLDNIEISELLDTFLDDYTL